MPFRKGQIAGTPYQKGHIPWNKGIRRIDIAGENHPNWKGGISKTVEWRRRKNKEYQLRNVEYFRLKAKMRKAKIRALGGMNINKIQMVYEDNIKKYGTLTCYLCLEPIEFGNDHLEHKVPISKGGTNEYCNLGVSCKMCNLSKKDLTVDEFLKKKEG